MSENNLLKMAIPAYRMHTQLFNNVIAGISTSDAKQRLSGRTNHILWMTGNLVNCRYWLAGVLGLSQRDPYEAFFADAKALDETYDYPDLATLQKEWHKISPLLFNKLCSLTEDELRQPYTLGMEVSFFEETLLTAVGMCIGREEYLFGQLALMRRALGYNAMSYQVDNSIAY
ncbi:DinB family protein [Olivibacter sp. SDN3]|uniref:DinB family protein n=1 Tax=Olivibacter sp. SDN3 TaxID=2764720 RepID=UPI00165166DF|nr:DinB family protein [Olivibacter sp. SDN3]QNL49571.1 DinB family protein [Olivibacter sp. SDN3]